MISTVRFGDQLSQESRIPNAMAGGPTKFTGRLMPSSWSRVTVAHGFTLSAEFGTRSPSLSAPS